MNIVFAMVLCVMSGSRVPRATRANTAAGSSRIQSSLAINLTLKTSKKKPEFCPGLLGYFFSSVFASPFGFFDFFFSVALSASDLAFAACAWRIPAQVAMGS